MVENLPRRIYRAVLKPDPWRKWTAASRALPDFLAIGAMRSGTTSLYDLVRRHPRVAPAIKKEVHFFDLHFSKGTRWYRAHFPPAEALRRAGRITGEATPYYIFHPAAPVRASELVPGAKIIAVLRHPVDRAYSHYWHSVGMKAEPLSFEDALDREPERLAGAERRLLEDPGFTSYPHIRFSYASRSIYVDQIDRWLDSYPRAQVLVLEHRTFFKDLDRQAPRLFDFLGLNPQPADLPRRLNKTIYPPMATRTRDRLLDFFAPHNTRLFERLGESFDWRD